MTTITIELPDQQAAELGLTLEGWFQKIATGTPAIDWSQCPAVESVPGRDRGQVQAVIEFAVRSFDRPPTYAP